MIASRMFLLMAVAVLIGSVLTKADVYKKCFHKVESGQGDRCRLAQDAINCYAENIENVNSSQALQDMNSIENDFECWGCPGNENIRVNVCKKAVYNGTDCEQGVSRKKCFVHAMRSATGKARLTLQKELPKYKREVANKCKDCSEIKIRESRNNCKTESESYILLLKSSEDKTELKCYGEKTVLFCFESEARCQVILPGYWSEVHEELLERKRTICSG